MTLEQLRIFLAVANLEHVTRAASQLGISQSAVSAAISALETRHAVQLFDRVGRRIALTDAGQNFVRAAEAVLAQAETAALVLEDFSATPRGRLRIHASQTVASYWLPRRLAALHDIFPQIVIELVGGNTAQVANAVLEGRADLGFVEGEVAQETLQRKVVARDRLVLAVSADHPWAQRAEVVPSEYPTQNWVIREQGSGTRSEFEHLLEAHGLDVDGLNVVLEFPSNEAVLSAVAGGPCVTVLSERAVVAWEAAGWVKAIAVPYPYRPFAVLIHPARHRTRAIQALLQLLDENPAASMSTLPRD
ncbi:LysR substrate-binding domain-containing protein [Halovulum sp. GXIMD14794]